MTGARQRQASNTAPSFDTSSLYQRSINPLANRARLKTGSPAGGRCSATCRTVVSEAAALKDGSVSTRCGERQHIRVGRKQDCSCRPLNLALATPCVLGMVAESQKPSDRLDTSQGALEPLVWHTDHPLLGCRTVIARFAECLESASGPVNRLRRHRGWVRGRAVLRGPGIKFARGASH